MNEVRRIVARAVVHGVVDEESRGRSGRMLHLGLGRLVLAVQVRVLHPVDRVNGAGAASGREVSLDLCEFGRVVRHVGRVEQDQSRIAVRRVDRLPVRRQTGRRGVPAADK